MLQVAPNDVEGDLDWDQAKTTCEQLGDGWRLPTKSELELMYKELHLKGIGNFETAGYWSNEEFSSTYAWAFYFDDGIFSYDMKRYNDYAPNYVRAVRTV